MTLLEIMMSLAVMLVGMLGLVRVLSVASRGGSTASHITQAQNKAMALLEVINRLPGGTQAPPPPWTNPVLQCLAGNAASSWSTCEAQCQQSVKAPTVGQACMLTTATMRALGQDTDSTQQQYAVVYDSANPARSTSVTPGTSTNGGFSQHLYQVQVTIGWNDDGTGPTGTSNVCLPAGTSHCVTLTTELFRN
jgi:Tfp pilus assembly protein PilV